MSRRISSGLVALILVLLLTVAASGIGQHDHSGFKTSCHACYLGNLILGQPSLAHRITAPALLAWRTAPPERRAAIGDISRSNDTRGPPLA